MEPAQALESDILKPKPFGFIGDPIGTLLNSLNLIFLDEAKNTYLP